jgi:nucleoside-diphosphate-sugar epimerase
MVGDVLDTEAVRRAVEGCVAVVNVAAASPGPQVSAELSRRVRVEGTTNLGAAARRAHARRFVVGSGYWVYADHPGRLEDGSPLDPRGESRINFAAEQAGIEEARDGELEVTIVRPGMVYGNGSWFRGMVGSLRDGTYAYPGDGTNFWSLVELTDAARAFGAVLDRGAAGEAYLVVDDAPITVRELASLVAGELGLPLPGGLPSAELERVVGADVTHHLAANRAGSNRKLRALGWVPREPDSRLGLPKLLRSMR